MYLCWSKGTRNWGDDCNLHLFKMITKEDPQFVSMNNPRKFNHYMSVGSILHFANEFTEVWGTGLRFDTIKIRKPKKVYAVRGPLTREILLRNAIDCPAIYGDPVLLLSKFYNPKIKKKYKLGVIPHYIDKKIVAPIKNKKILKIDIQSDFYKVIHDVLSCERIVSSSLHGLILADAYKVPNKWIKFSDKVEGAHLKFNDYFLSVGREQDNYIDYKNLLSFNDIFKYLFQSKIDVDLNKLYNSCPFKRSIDE